ncbi:MAG: mucoidy inhibitor MuiA family protein, partial [Sphingobacteriaceae bacterium]
PPPPKKGSTYLLNFGMYYASPKGSITRVTGTVSDSGGALPGAYVKVKGTSIGATADVNGKYSIQVPGGSPILVFSFVGYEPKEIPANTELINVQLNASTQALDEVVVVGYGYYSDKKIAPALQGRVQGIKVKQSSTIPVGVQQQENQTNVEFNIENPYSVPSDGKQYVVEINNVDIEATYQYYTAPKISTDVFLTATVTDWNKYNFLSGEANIFFEGTFIGKSLIDTYATNDTLSLSLGTDKNIVVTRTLQKDMEKKAFSSTKKEIRDWLITIKNRKNQPVSLLLEDQVPVSQNNAIEVETQETSGGKLDPATGKLSWSFILNSQQEKKIQLKYQVKYPKNQSVIVQ